jgi:4a-hydroxytetrahydrobiopterin dehydratase
MRTAYAIFGSEATKAKWIAEAIKQKCTWNRTGITSAMSSTLNEEKCTACRRDSPSVTEEEIRTLKPAVPEWKMVERDGIRRLERVFNFPNFSGALEFTNRVGALAEEEGHHPAILTEWGRVTVTLWTHKIRALHRNDFVMASKIDSLVFAS